MCCKWEQILQWLFRGICNLARLAWALLTFWPIWIREAGRCGQCQHAAIGLIHGRMANVTRSDRLGRARVFVGKRHNMPSIRPAARRAISLFAVVVAGSVTAQEAGKLPLETKGAEPMVVTPVMPEAMRQSCLEATNGCQVCVVLLPARTMHCSMPGIACQPSPWICNKRG